MGPGPAADAVGAAQVPVLSPAARELVGGCVAGAANVVSGFPFDTIKVRLQSSSPGEYRGPVHCLREVVSREGARGLFRGMSSPLVGGTLETGVNYLVFSRVLEALRPEDLPPGAPAPLSRVAAAGAVGAVALSGILAPTELLKCRMQQPGSSATYPGGPLQVARELVAAKGWVGGLGRGFGATLAREVPGNALFFVTYEALRRALPRRSAAEGQPRSGRHWVEEVGTAIFCGGAAGTVMWAVVFPIDAAKTRLQVEPLGSPRWGLGLAGHMAMMWREGRWASLYAGLTPCLARAFPANACQWLAWELAMRGMEGDGSTLDAVV
ncbi:hypothetical protein HYH03_019098 [Edaphochlamys debaryana]|uniref:Uncharacterized protein n=1 Tax=Edaphochlamys debaryana TaxID=47281 RepID=A0A836BNP7_9CHLO|nr:hypothetical protein HYH03_019098 [Edaphochlamys debaryana]|eukprot:KAG2481944.1 hypothetical protein HYH03_019098 [Edaphochlamys debaryana]